MGSVADLRPLYERIMEKVIPEPNSGCWLYLGILDKDGYGRVVPSRLSNLKRRPMSVHRIMYENFTGKPIESPLTIDHKCKVRCCCNPQHMEPVTNVVNVMRGESLFAQNARKTECKRGHPLSGYNLRVNSKGERQCRACCCIRTQKSLLRDLL